MLNVAEGSVPTADTRGRRARVGCARSGPARRAYPAATRCSAGRLRGRTVATAKRCSAASTARPTHRSTCARRLAGRRGRNPDDGGGTNKPPERRAVRRLPKPRRKGGDGADGARAAASTMRSSSTAPSGRRRCRTRSRRSSSPTAAYATTRWRCGGVHAAFLKKHGLQASQVPLLKLHNDRLGSAAPFESVKGRSGTTSAVDSSPPSADLSLSPRRRSRGRGGRRRRRQRRQGWPAAAAGLVGGDPHVRRHAHRRRAAHVHRRSWLGVL